MSKMYSKEKEPTKLSAASLKKEKLHTEARRKQNKYQLLTDDLTDEELDKIAARLGSC